MIGWCTRCLTQTSVRSFGCGASMASLLQRSVGKAQANSVTD
jgi:hypothetical protein